jgi:hypothetical protein
MMMRFLKIIPREIASDERPYIVDVYAVFRVQNVKCFYHGAAPHMRPVSQRTVEIP